MKISACLIVKDEETTLARCLKGLRPVCRELIVVDTGSRDNTKGIAAAWGARVFDFRWVENFSAARNYSLAQARQPWILVCDADEVLDPADYSLLRQIPDDVEADGYEMIIRNYFTSPSFSVMEKVAVPNRSAYATGREYPYYVDHDLLRLFRNDPRLRFSGRIHETVGGVFAKHGLRVAKSPVVLHHFGKVLLHREEEKRALYLELAEQRIRETPDDVQSQVNYGIQLFVAGRWSECASVLGALQQKRRLENEMIYVYLSRAYLALQRFGEALESARQAMRLNAVNPLTHCLLGEAQQGLGQTVEAGQAFRHAAELAPHLAEPLVGLANLAWTEGRHEESLGWLQKSLERDAQNPSILELLAARLISNRRYEAALPYCHRLIEGPEKSKAERWFLFLGLYYLQNGPAEKASELLRNGLSVFPNHPRLQTLGSYLNL